MNYGVEFKRVRLISLWEIALGDMTRDSMTSDPKFIFSSKVFHVSAAKNRFSVCSQGTAKYLAASNLAALWRLDSAVNHSRT